MKKDVLFEKYAMMIRKRAHDYASKYDVDYSELESQGFLIYCQCLEKYDVSKSNFSTYLYIQLNRLGDYVKTYKRQQGVMIQDYYANSMDNNFENDYETMLPSREFAPAVEDFLVEARQALSENAYALMEWIVGRSWECKNKRTPTVSMAVKHFHIDLQVAEKLWEECKNFWNCQGSMIYA